MAQASTSLDNSGPPEYVSDPANDIATNLSRERMRVNIPNRQKYQKIFVWRGVKGETTNTSYQPDDVDQNWQPSCIPSREEIESDASKTEMLVVGLVLLDDPLKYSTENTGQRSREKDMAREARGVLDRPARVTRALVPVTEYISKVCNCFVAIEPFEGVPHTRKIRSSTIFFFSEFLPENFNELVLKQKITEVANLCKEAAARDKRKLGNDAQNEDPRAARRLKAAVVSQDEDEEEVAHSSELRDNAKTDCYEIDAFSTQQFNTDSSATFRADVLANLIDTANCLRDFVTTAIKEHHDVHANKSIDTIMANVGDTIDRATFELKCRELLATDARRCDDIMQKVIHKADGLIMTLKTGLSKKHQPQGSDDVEGEEAADV